MNLNANQAVPAGSEFRLGRCLITPLLNRIEVDGRVTTLEPRVMELLVYLSQRHGQVVSRDQAIEALWQGAVVTDDAVTRAVSLIRKATRGGGTVIETVSKRGYRVVLAPEPVSTTTVPHWRRASLIGLSLAALFIVFRVVEHEPQTPPPATISTRPLTALLGNEIFPDVRVASDEVVFSWNAPGPGLPENQYSLFRQSISGGVEPVRLTRTPSTDIAPTWSPDGQRIAFARAAGAQMHIMAVGRDGGDEKLLGTAQASWIYGLDWSPDGRYLALNDQIATGGPNYIARLDLEQGAFVQLTHPDQTLIGDRMPKFSVDGQHLAFVRRAADGDDQVWIKALPGAERRVLSGDGRVASLDWIGPTELLVSRGEQPVLQRVSIGGSIRPYGTLDVAHSRRVAAASGGAVVFEHLQTDNSIWQFAAGVGKPWLQTTTNESIPRWSPDGSRVAFVSDRLGHQQLWLADVDGSKAFAVTAPGGRPATPAWAPDGESIAYLWESAGDSRIHILTLENLESRPLPTGDGLQPRFSADGRSLLFASRRSGRWEIWELPLAPSAEPQQVTRTGGYLAFDAGEQGLFAARFDEDGLWRVDRQTGMSERILDAGWSGRWGTWAMVDGGFVFADREAEPHVSIRRMDLATGAISEVGTVPNIDQHGLTASRDGSSVLVGYNEYTRIDLRVTIPH